MPSFNRILVPIDFSSPSARALEVAIDFAKLFGAALSIVHVEQPLTVPASVPYMPPLSGLEGVTAAARAACAEQLSEAAQQARAAGVSNVDTELLEGIAWCEIVDRAKRGAHDLVVIGTHGRSGVQRVLLGSVAERVVRKAPCAVLTVRPEQTAALDTATPKAMQA